MKQKIEIKVPMNDQKSRSKALKVSVGISGIVESAALTGPEKDQLEVVGEGIDAVELVRQLRKNVGNAELVRVGEAKKDKQVDAVKVQATTQQPTVDWSYAPQPTYAGYPAHYHFYETTRGSAYNSNDPACCTIM